MYQYEALIKQLLNGRNFKIRGQNLRCSCPFHDEDTHPSFSIDLEKGMYNCFACGTKGSITNFVAEMTGVSTSEAWQEIKSIVGIEDDNYTSQNNLSYSLEDYAREKYINIDDLKTWKIEDSNDGKGIKIPYFDLDGNFIAFRHRNNPQSETRFWWEGGSLNLYGLNYLNRFKDDYIILVERRIRLPFIMVI